ncbi:MAG: 3-hydroxyisobutyrate dehydrogenase-like beta-hydroxyacid dehydrogenase [Acidimicrobiales bacterium]|jgi:3-hydroxyisobutyrate dehydrogenase-like beta-hydroxyacid dehydrogenase
MYNKVNRKHLNKQIAFVGLGKMGATMSAHLSEQGFDVHGSDANADTLQQVAMEVLEHRIA